MTLHRFSLQTIQKIRQHIQAMLVLPEAENHPRVWSSYQEVDELPEPDSLGGLGELFNFGGLLEENTFAPNIEGRWFISSVNPATALMKLPGLQLKADLRLASYLYRTQHDGVGITWAVPAALGTTAHLETALLKCGDRTHPPHPPNALAEVMEAVKGDRSPSSFLIASILQRELQEFGALGKLCDWSHHRFIETLPTQVAWQWNIEAPKDLTPKLKLFPDGKVAVEFFTCRVVAPVALYQHIDQYPSQHYTAAKLNRIVATAHKT